MGCMRIPGEWVDRGGEAEYKLAEFQSTASLTR